MRVCVGVFMCVKKVSRGRKEKGEKWGKDNDKESTSTWQLYIAGKERNEGGETHICITTMCM